MYKFMLIVALVSVLGWFGIRQHQRAEVDSDVASLNRMMASNPVQLPNLSTPALSVEPVVATVDARASRHH
jgi:hypothetical protein